MNGEKIKNKEEEIKLLKNQCGQNKTFDDTILNLSLHTCTTSGKKLAFNYLSLD